MNKEFRRSFRPRSDWFRNMTEPPASLELSAQKQSLCLEVEWFCLLSPPLAAEGAFYEGLWAAEVAELFIQVEDGHYLEFNLAPNGAWWACEFSASRVRTNLDLKRCGQGQKLGPNRSALDISLQELGKVQSYNLTAISGTVDQRFYTFADLPGKEPDFHQPDHFLPWPL